MPFYESAEEWRRQSSLLLQARPTTARITTKYTVPNLKQSKYTRRIAQNAAFKERKAATSDGKADSTQSQAPRAYLVLKTYDPESGVTLKYKTDKAAEVGRLIGSLGRLGRHMAALPDMGEDTAAALPSTEPMQIDEPGTPNPDTSKGQAPAAGGTGGASAKKKKKGGKR